MRMIAAAAVTNTGEDDDDVAAPSRSTPESTADFGDLSFGDADAEGLSFNELPARDDARGDDAFWPVGC